MDYAGRGEGVGGGSGVGLGGTVGVGLEVLRYHDDDWDRLPPDLRSLLHEFQGVFTQFKPPHVLGYGEGPRTHSAGLVGPKDADALVVDVNLHTVLIGRQATVSRTFVRRPAHTPIDPDDADTGRRHCVIR